MVLLKEEKWGRYCTMTYTRWENSGDDLDVGRQDTYPTSKPSFKNQGTGRYGSNPQVIRVITGKRIGKKGGKVNSRAAFELLVRGGE